MLSIDEETCWVKASLFRMLFLATSLTSFSFWDVTLTCDLFQAQRVYDAMRLDATFKLQLGIFRRNRMYTLLRVTGSPNLDGHVLTTAMK